MMRWILTLFFWVAAANAAVDFAPHNLTNNSSADGYYYVYADSYANGSWVPRLAFDGGTGAGWSSDAVAAPKWLALVYLKPQVLTSYAITGNGTEAPKDWKLQGSNDGSTWVDLDSRTNQTAWGATEQRTYTVTGNTSAFLIHRLYVTAKNGTYVQVLELSLYADSLNADTDLAPHNMTGPSTPSPFVTSGGQVSDYSPYKMFDGVANNGFLSWVSTAGMSATLDLGSSKPLGAYAIWNVNASDAPTAWTVDGSINGSSWTTLDTRSGVSWPNDGMLNVFELASPSVAYRYYRITVSAGAGGTIWINEFFLVSATAFPHSTTHRFWRLNVKATDSNYISLSELELRNSYGGSDLTGSGTASASSVASGAASNAVDNNTGSIWATYSNKAPQWWAYDFGVGNAFNIKEVQITPRATYYFESPGYFNVEWSDDNSTWTVAWVITGAVYTNTTPRVFNDSGAAWPQTWPTLVKQSAVCDTLSSTLNCALPSNVTAGNAIVVLQSGYGASSCSGTPVSDARSSIFSLVKAANNINGNAAHACIFLATLTSSGPETVSKASTTMVQSMWVYEVDMRSPVADATAAVTADATTSISSGSLTTSHSRALLLCSVSGVGPLYTPFNTVTSPTGAGVSFWGPLGDTYHESAFIVKEVSAGTQTCTVSAGGSIPRLAIAGALISARSSGHGLTPYIM